MIPQSIEERYVPKVIMSLCTYEAVAIASRKRVPTISAGVWKMYGTQWGKPLLWMIWGWLTSHFFSYIEDAEKTVS